MIGCTTDATPRVRSASRVRKSAITSPFPYTTAAGQHSSTKYQLHAIHNLLQDYQLRLPAVSLPCYSNALKTNQCKPGIPVNIGLPGSKNQVVSQPPDR